MNENKNKNMKKSLICKKTNICFWQKKAVADKLSVVSLSISLAIAFFIVVAASSGLALAYQAFAK